MLPSIVHLGYFCITQVDDLFAESGFKGRVDWLLGVIEEKRVHGMIDNKNIISMLNHNS